MITPEELLSCPWGCRPSIVTYGINKGRVTCRHARTVMTPEQWNCRVPVAATAPLPGPKHYYDVFPAWSIGGAGGARNVPDDELLAAIEKAMAFSPNCEVKLVEVPAGGNPVAATVPKFTEHAFVDDADISRPAAQLPDKVCSLCVDLAELNEDEQVWRHAGHPEARGLMVPGEGCDRYGYPIEVKDMEQKADIPIYYGSALCIPDQSAFTAMAAGLALGRCGEPGWQAGLSGRDRISVQLLPALWASGQARRSMSTPEADMERALETAKEIVQHFERHGRNPVYEDMQDVARALISCREPVNAIERPFTDHECSNCGNQLRAKDENLLPDAYCAGCGRPIKWPS